MPRIAAALAVAVTLAFCIVFNTIRYPAVWEMIAPAEPATRTAEAGAAGAKPVAAPASTAAAVPSPWPIGRPASGASAPAASLPPLMPPTWADGGRGQATTPITMVPSERFASARTSAAPAAAGRNDAGGWMADSGTDPLLSLGTAESAPRTRRLPPVDQTATGDSPLALVNGSLPIYPTTRTK
jgi:hypothetical protein